MLILESTTKHDFDNSIKQLLDYVDIGTWIY